MGDIQNIGVTNLSFTQDEVRRKVSMSSEAIHADQERQRKLSSTSSKHRKSTGVGCNGDRQRKISSPASIHGGEERSWVTCKCRRSLHRHHHSTDTVHSHADEEQHRKISTTSSVKHCSENNNHHSPIVCLEHQYQNTARIEETWWYLLCIKCRQKESGPGWEPGFWQSVCPYPFCPTYRHVARCFSLILVVVLAWGVVYSVVGEDAAPGGQLFIIAFLAISAHFGGYVFRMCNLPGLVGMLCVGVIYQNIGLVDIHGPYMKFCAILRRIALVIILTRAGLDLDPGAMKRLFGTILKIGLVPWTVEVVAVTAFLHLLLGMPWIWSLLAASVVAAVSPAVIVPGLMRLRGKGYGVAKGIPTIVIAISGIDDAASVAAFGIIHSLLFSEYSLLYNMGLGLISVVVGVVYGVLWGLISKYFPEKEDKPLNSMPFVVPLRILMLLVGGMIAVFGFDLVHLEGAGPLGVVAAAFVSAWSWSNQHGWDIEHNPVATAFEIFWMVFEPILFSLTGTQIRIREIDLEVFLVAVGILITAFSLRIVSTVLVSFGGTLNMKEKWFIAFACQAKASVQAALAPVVLGTVMAQGGQDGPERGYAETVLIVCVLSIVLTAPTGAIIIYFAGPRMLSKTARGLPPSLVRSRPSLRDITVIDEGNETDDIERRMSQPPSRKVSECTGQELSQPTIHIVTIQQS